MTDTGDSVQLDVNSVVVVASGPRLLASIVSGGGLKFACVVAHAPTSSATQDCIQKWWGELDIVLRRLPRDALPLLFLDGNARFVNWECGGAMQGVPKGLNAMMLQDLLHAHELDSCACYDEQGALVTTWVAPGGQASMIGYIVMPAALAQVAVTKGTPRDLVDQLGWDHWPLLVTLQWQAPATPGIQKVIWDRSKCGPRKAKAY